MKIAIVGAGNVGTNLHHAFETKGIQTELLRAHDLLAADLTPSQPSPQGKENSSDYAGDQCSLPCGEGKGGVATNFDVYIYTVADQVLREVAACVHAPKALHLHTSGTMPIDVFGEDKPHAGAMYFFQSFSKNSLIDDWSGIPCIIEGRNIDDVAAVYSLAQTLTSRIYEANRHDRERLHIAGVFANNFSNLMYRMAEEVLRDTQIPFEALLPLIDRTAAKVHTMRPSEAQTGPAQRGDGEVVLHHMEVLEKMPDGAFFNSDLQFVYMSLSQIIQSGNGLKETEPKSIMELLTQALEASDGTTHTRQVQPKRRGKYPED